MLYTKNLRSCLTMTSKHEKAYEARGAKPLELFIAFECFEPSYPLAHAFNPLSVRNFPDFD